MAHGAQDWYTLTWAILSMNFLDLQDTPNIYTGHDGEAPVVDEPNQVLVFAAPAPAAHKATHQAGGADVINVAGLSGELVDDQPSNFLKLSDTPGSYAGKATYACYVNAAENALEFAVPLTTAWLKVAEIAASADSYIEFTSLDPTKIYRILYRIEMTANAQSLYCRIHNDTGAVYRSNTHFAEGTPSHTVTASGWVTYINLFLGAAIYWTIPVFGELIVFPREGQIYQNMVYHRAHFVASTQYEATVMTTGRYNPAAGPGIDSIRIYASGGGITGLFVLYEWVE